ncbi:hypothetical protein BB560_001624 [Smittium megazygosporum]|uniref:N-acyl-aliphatic-L-amino acid amidohydrolase n=1 Tax=Smittium megazygosporum TaxID=133381 RepID=A0A2T9ZH40_9FUNG|nr:hypothetical protein BB560_001624 [Smittium megazygosporum]
MAEETAPVSRFREYLQIKTVHPEPDYDSCTKFLLKQAEEIGLEHQIHECVKGKPVVILTSKGTDSSEKSVLFNSHTDVVPVFEEKWNYPPFEAQRVKMEDGEYRIYARGSQDMKVTGSMYLEAIREIKKSNIQHKRDIHLIFGPDEEIYSTDGLDVFTKTPEFAKLNGGFDIDEGAPSFNDETWYFTSERITCPVTFTATGKTGHGSQFIEDTAAEKILPIVNELLQLRQTNLDKIKHHGPLMILHQGEVTSANLTMLSGGKQPNVVPATYEATFDFRVTPNIDYGEFIQYLKDLAARNGCTVVIKKPAGSNPVTNLSEAEPFTTSFHKVLKKHNKKAHEIIMPAATDARFIRRAGIPAVGINPLNFHKLLAHDHNEYIVESEFLKGIPFYQDMMIELANA